MKMVIFVFILSILLGLLIAISNAAAGCTTYIMPDGRIVTMCCDPSGTLCQFM